MENVIINKVCIVGLGYIGLPTAAILAANEIEVIGIDTNPQIVSTINDGRIHIVEPGLDELVLKCVKTSKLRAVLVPEEADAFIIAVPTPVSGKTREPNLSYIHSAAVSIARVLKPGNLVVLESTSPVGATEQLIQWLAAERRDLKFPGSNNDSLDINIAYCPERVLPGNVIHELVNNDRIIGGMTNECSRQAVSLYKKFVQAKCHIASNPRVAEMAKLTENSYRDVNIAFANELSIISDKLNIDVWELINLANKHPRVSILKPGAGVGGHCIAVDPWFIINSAPDETQLIQTARNVNDYKPAWILKNVNTLIDQYLAEHQNKSASELTVAFYGIAFKPDIDDLRESPAKHIVAEFINIFSGSIIVVEPNIEKLPVNLMTADLLHYHDAKQKADIHVILVAHSEFQIHQFDQKKYVIDAVGLTSGIEK